MFLFLSFTIAYRNAPKSSAHNSDHDCSTLTSASIVCGAKSTRGDLRRDVEMILQRLTTFREVMGDLRREVKHDLVNIDYFSEGHG
jgi:hypothetical protein